MNRKMYLTAALAAFASLTVALPAAIAGGGMGPGSNMTTCRVVLNGAPKQDQVAAIQDAFLTSETKDTVKIGTLALICDIPSVGTTLNPAPGTNGTGNPVPLNTATSISCYSVGGADKARIPGTVQDAFTTTFDPAGTYGVTLGAIEFVCVPSCLNGCLPPAPAAQ